MKKVYARIPRTLLCKIIDTKSVSFL